MIHILIWTPGTSIAEIQGTYTGKLTVKVASRENDEQWIAVIHEAGHSWYAGRSSYGSTYAPACWRLVWLKQDPCGKEDHWRIVRSLKWGKDTKHGDPD